MRRNKFKIQMLVAFCMIDGCRERDIRSKYRWKGAHTPEVRRRTPCVEKEKITRGYQPFVGWKGGEREHDQGYGDTSECFVQTLEFERIQGYGNASPLQPIERYTAGRAQTSARASKREADTTTNMPPVWLNALTYTEGAGRSEL